MKYYYFEGSREPFDEGAPRLVIRYFAANTQQELDAQTQKHSWRCELYSVKEITKDEYDALLAKEAKQREYIEMRKWLRVQSWYW